MQKLITILAVLVFTVSLAGCGPSEEEKKVAAEEQLRKTFPSEVKPMPKPRQKDPSHW